MSGEKKSLFSSEADILWLATVIESEPDLQRPDDCKGQGHRDLVRVLSGMHWVFRLQNDSIGFKERNLDYQF